MKAYIVEWISVTERLPEPGERVLMLLGNAVFEGFVTQSGQWDRYNNICGTLEEFFGAIVTHWMLLPKTNLSDLESVME